MELLVKGGQLVAVVRPSDPVKALATADKIAAMPHQWPNQIRRQQQAFQQMLDLQPYQFKGYLAKDYDKETGKAWICTKTGTVLELVQDGDSFVDERAIDFAAVAEVN